MTGLSGLVSMTTFFIVLLVKNMNYE